MSTDGYQMCPSCGHHTSAYAGKCTVIDPGTLAYCGCDCRVAMGGKSLVEVVAEMWKEGDNDDRPAPGVG